MTPSTATLLKNGIINTCLLLLSCALSLLLLEQGFRLWLFGLKAFDREAMRNNVPIVNTGFMRQSPFDDIYWALQPDLDTTFKLARLTTNSAGLADREYRQEKPPGTFRIAVLGDSYSMATGVDTDKSYHALLEEQLRRDGHAMELLNFAVGGFGLERYNATLEHLVPAWQPDAILLGYCAFNDHFALPPKTGSVPPFNPHRADGFRLSYLQEYWRLRHAAWQAGSVGTLLGEKQRAFIDGEFARTRALANRIKPGMPILLAYLDNRPHSAEDIATLRTLAEKHGMTFVDATAPFASTAIDDYSIHLLDSHPNTAAHMLFADQLYRAVAALPQTAAGTAP